mmetsp:Transcript_94426/g.206681  ORF Transcript_94426/g.206681 Transcript_94426/m.206681 type:complete len:176 (-) Transcript_94426:183-710(-)
MTVAAAVAVETSCHSGFGEAGRCDLGEVFGGCDFAWGACCCWCAGWCFDCRAALSFWCPLGVDTGAVSACGASQDVTAGPDDDAAAAAGTGRRGLLTALRTGDVRAPSPVEGTVFRAAAVDGFGDHLRDIGEGEPPIPPRCMSRGEKLLETMFLPFHLGEKEPRGLRGAPKLNDG